MKLSSPKTLRAQRYRQQQHHGKACVDRAGHKVGRKNRRVPAGNNSYRKIEADDRMHRKHQRRCQPGQQQVSRLVAMPVTSGTAPAHRQHAVDQSKRFAAGPIAQGRKVRNQTDKPKQGGHGRVCRHREHVPHQGAAKLRPNAHGIRVRKQPVTEPRSPQVHEREDAGLRDREQGHGFRESVDRSAPLLSQQKQDCRNQSSRVTDADPPNKV